MSTDITTITIRKGEASYPLELLDLVDPPEVLHIRGRLPQSFKNALAVVGSRDVTAYGVSTVNYFVKTLASQKITIISGFMYGVDTYAHRAALAVSGITVAVLGHGLDYVYPPENKDLYHTIIKEGGCIISEYEDDFKPQKWTFPQRNRIIAALSQKGTLVIEAAERSGSLITASYADALNRPLFAVPGSLFSKNSKGTNQLIKDNIARMVTNPREIL